MTDSPKPKTAGYMHRKLVEQQLENHSRLLTSSPATRNRSRIAMTGMSSPASTAATTSPPSPRRTVYALTDDRGWVLYQLEGSRPTFSPDPILALRNGFAWLGQEVAQAKRHTVQQQLKGLALGIAAIELVQRAGGWEAVSMVGGLQ